MSGYLFLIVFFSCSALVGVLPEEDGWQQFYARGHAPRVLLYRGKTFSTWQRKEILYPNLDTVLPIGEFAIGSVRLTIHNFPIQKNEPRIPPLAQVTRWQQQFNLYSAIKTTLSPVARAGFCGLFLEALEEPTAVLGWSMQLTKEHVRPGSAMQADYTIKAVGPLKSILQHRKDIESFMRSFELIEALP